MDPSRHIMQETICSSPGVSALKRIINLVREPGVVEMERLIIAITWGQTLQSRKSSDS